MTRSDFRTYPNIGRHQIDVMLGELLINGATITGNNPWHIDTRQSGVKLRGEWSEDSSTLSVTLTGKGWYAPSSVIWRTIESLISQISGPLASDETSVNVSKQSFTC